MPLSEKELEHFKKQYSTPNVADIGLRLYNATQKNPDSYAEDLELAKDQKLPVDTVERNRDEIKRRKFLKELNTKELQETNPKTAEYLKSGRNAEVSYDDLEVLKRLEISAKTPERSFVNNISNAALNRVNALTGNLIEFVGNLSANTYDEMSEALGLPNPGVIIGEDGISWSWDIPRETPSAISNIGKAISEGQGYDYIPNFTWEKLKGDVTPTNLAGYVVEQGVQSIPDMLAALYTLPAYIASRTEEIAESRVQNDKRTKVTNEDLVESLIPATTVALIERLGAKITFGKGKVNSLKTAAKATGAAAAIEGTTEFIQEQIEYLGERVGTQADVDVAQMLDQGLAGLVAGSGIGGGIRGTTASVEALANYSSRSINREVLSELDQDTLDEWITYAQESKTQKRPGNQFGEFVDSLNSDHEVYIAQDALKDIPGLPAVITDKMGEVFGSDITLSLREFMTDVAPFPNIVDPIRQHLRISSETASQQELEELEATAENLVKKATEEKQLADEAEDIYEQVKDELVATGRQAEKTAKFSAALFPAWAKVKAEELGIRPQEAFERMGLTVTKLEEPSAPAPSTEPTLAPTQDFAGIKFVDDVVISETGKKAKLTQNAQTLWNRTQKRKDVVNKVVECLRK